MGTPGHFKSSTTAATGLTQDISFLEGHAFKDPKNPLLRAYDMPGFGDMNIPLVKILADIT
jgi:hypothetical protein